MYEECSFRVCDGVLGFINGVTCEFLEIMREFKLPRYKRVSYHFEGKAVV